jgi:hypothetical protein
MRINDTFAHFLKNKYFYEPVAKLSSLIDLMNYSIIFNYIKINKLHYFYRRLFDKNAFMIIIYLYNYHFI